MVLSHTYVSKQCLAIGTDKKSIEECQCLYMYVHVYLLIAITTKYVRN